MAKVTGNTMNLGHLFDFYFLEAMRAGLMMAKSAHPEMPFRHSVERLENDLETTFSEISHNIALRLYVYLWTTALGEARHAEECCETYIKQLSNTTRSYVYEKSLKYFPSDKNVEIITGIYEQKWSYSSYGGNAWLSIVEGMKLYGKIPHAAFIDHVVDLEHNSGSVFSKCTSNLQFDNNYVWPSVFRSFLDVKFSHNILQVFILKGNDGHLITRGTYRLLQRYNNIVEPINAVNGVRPGLETLSPYSIEWEYNEFEVGVSSEYEEERETFKCDNCGEWVRKTIYVDGESDDYCRYCYENYVVQCEDCNHDIHIDHSQVSEDGYTLCDSCAMENTCTECSEVHFQDMQKHDENNHPLDYEKVEEISEKIEVGYQWVEKWNTCEADTMFNAIEQVETFALLGAKTYIKTQKTFTPDNCKPITTTVYDSGEGLFVYRLEDGVFVIMCPNMLYAKNTSIKTLPEALDIMHKMLKVLDWKTIQTKLDWANVPKETIELVKQAVYGG